MHQNNSQFEALLQQLALEKTQRMKQHNVRIHSKFNSTKLTNDKQFERANPSMLESATDKLVLNEKSFVIKESDEVNTEEVNTLKILATSTPHERSSPDLTR